MAPAISIKIVSVRGPHSAPPTDNQHRRMENSHKVHGLRIESLRIEQSIWLWFSATLAHNYMYMKGATHALSVTGDHAHVSMTCSSRQGRS